MTIKDLLLLVGKKLSEFPWRIDDAYLDRILAHSTMHKIDFRTRTDLDSISEIYFEYGTAETFDIEQLSEELEPGFYVYSYIATEDDIRIEYFVDKIIAFNHYRKLNEKCLVCEKALVDTANGILAGEKLTGDVLTSKQYELFRAWMQRKYPVGAKVQLLRLCEKSKANTFDDRSQFIGKIGTVIDLGFYNIITIDFGKLGTECVEVGKDQIRIIEENHHI